MPFLVLLSLLLSPVAPQEKFIVLSEFQVWADAAGPHVFRELNQLYLKKGRSHVFNLYPHYEYYVWDLERMKKWVDEAVELNAFNVFCIGDDTRTAQGHLFTTEGLNPKLADFFFRLTAYAHTREFMVAVEPTALPDQRDKAHFIPWLETWIGKKIPAENRPDIIKLSLEWFHAYGYNPEIADEVEAFLLASKKVNPDVLVYIDSIGGYWKQPSPFHAWLLHRFPGTIVSHYLGTDQIDAFRNMGARNMMVQINPSEIAGKAGQFFIYHDRTVDFLKDAVQKRVRYLSLAGVNFGYNRYNYDLFLEVIRPHLKLAKNVQELRASLLPDQIATPAGKAQVKEDMIQQRKIQRRKRIEKGWRDQKIPMNKANRHAVFGATTEDCFLQNLAAIADGKVASRFQGSYSEPVQRQPVSATFGRDFGQERTIRHITVVPCLHPEDNTYVAVDFDLEYRWQNVWKPLPRGMFQNNHKSRVSLDFDPVQADAVRLVIKTETDDGKGNYRACCQELDVK